jgi:ADP-L-glycero-D-manno-heptose 6-epimerase
LFSASEQPPLIEFIDMPAQLLDKYQYFTQARVTRLRQAGYRQAFTTLEAGIEDYVRNYLLRTDRYR